ncbi:hypothetical protein T12_15764 [Trichinella patagoniensis]|uniref:Uncharacterized protein n=1 Tax=Trichinella patagoniensis TaxID=990121 RepID=A0A0V1A9R5_9BILA|nr:hypothetical protein T12_15764 [Trichinella patagoniensis]
MIWSSNRKPSTTMIRKCDRDHIDENVTWNSLKMPATVCIKCTAHLLNITIPCSVHHVKSCSDMAQFPLLLRPLSFLNFDCCQIGIYLLFFNVKSEQNGVFYIVLM